MSTVGAPKEPRATEMGSPESGKAARAVWAPGLFDRTTDHEVRRVWPPGVQTVKGRRKEH